MGDTRAPVRFTMESDIATPAEHAFDTMADARNEPRWNSRVSRSELLSEEPVGPGSRFATVNRGREYEATISAYERPSRLGFEVTGSGMDITASFDFRDKGDGTHMSGSFDMRPKGAMKALLPLMSSLVRRDMATQAERFRALCEADRAQAGP